MDISIKISNRELNPQVVNFFQFENETTTLNFTLDSYMYGEVDLRNYTAYAITSINGDIDMTELVKTYDEAEDKLNLTWDVQEYSLRQEGAITYQIVFKEDILDGENTAVFYTYKGIMINRGSVDADNHITANYPTILKQWIDRINELATEFGTPIHYSKFGEDMPISERMDGRIYYQYDNVENTVGHFEDHLGNILSEFDKYMTNCITEIPQDIKLELKDGVLTLKAGSKVYVPNEGGGFDEIVVSEDKTATIINNNEYYLVCTNSGSVSWAATNTTASGTSVPSDHNGLFYNTTNNTVRFYTGGVSSGVVFSLPIARVTVANNICTSIDEVFNGFGYIGSTVYALPGVKGYAPNGRYANGKLKNAEFETKYVRMRTFSNTENDGVCLLFNGDSFARLSKDLYVYDEVKNVNGDGTYEYVHTHIGSCTLTNGVISNFKIKNQFRSVDWNDFNDLINRVIKLENSAVRLTGDQTIGEGVKTFTDEIFAPNQLDYSRITNCITHIPQDIKLELVDGTLTLKAGSKVWIPYGTTEAYQVGDIDAYGNTVVATSWDGAKFFYAIELQSDVSLIATFSTPKKWLVNFRLDESRIDINYLENNKSGNDPTGFTYGFYYNTNDNTIFDYRATKNYQTSLPLAIITDNGTTVGSIDQTFNGFGYIGSTVFALPGVRGLIPNGRNADGSLKNIETVSTSVSTWTSSGSTYDYYIGLNAVGIANVCGKPNYSYNEEKNFTYNDSNIWYDSVFCYIKCVSGTITSFTPKRVFKAADDQDVLHKYGDEVKSGDLTVDGNAIFYNSHIGSKRSAQYLKNNYFDYTKPEEANSLVSSLYFTDKNDELYGALETFAGSDGYTKIYLNVRGKNGKWASAPLQLVTDGASSVGFAPTPKQCVLEDDEIATTAFTNRSTFCRFQGVADIGSGYITPHVGFIAVRAGGNNRTSWCDFNGNRVFDSGWGASYGSPDNEFIPVGKGVTITFAGLGYIKFFYNTTV